MYEHACWCTFYFVLTGSVEKKLNSKLNFEKSLEIRFQKKKSYFFSLLLCADPFWPVAFPLHQADGLVLFLCQPTSRANPAAVALGPIQYTGLVAKPGAKFPFPSPCAADAPVPYVSVATSFLSSHPSSKPSWTRASTALQSRFPRDFIASASPI